MAVIGGFVVTFALTSLLLVWLDRQSTRSQLEAALGHDSETASEHSGFAQGRLLLGSNDARVHVTVVSDYQCPACRRFDAQLQAMTAGRDDVSISARHFPFRTYCNEHVKKTRYPNACRAAVAVEAVGIAGGNDAFWPMHD